MPAIPGRRVRSPRSDGLANRERVLSAAVVVVKANGEDVPLATIADKASVGIGTLYRHFPTRERLMEALTDRAFRLVLTHARSAAERRGTAIEAIEAFFDQTIDRRDDLVLPSHGGPTKLSADVRSALAEILERGHEDGTIRSDVTARDTSSPGRSWPSPWPASLTGRQWPGPSAVPRPLGLPPWSAAS